MRSWAMEEYNLEMGADEKRTEKMLSNLGKSITQKCQDSSVID